MTTTPDPAPSPAGAASADPVGLSEAKNPITMSLEEMWAIRDEASGDRVIALLAEVDAQMAERFRERTAREAVKRERDDLLAEREKAGSAWFAGGISPRAPDGSWMVCLGYHEDTDGNGEYEWGEVVLKSVLVAAESRQAEALRLAEEAIRDGERWCAVCATNLQTAACPHFRDVRARLAALLGEGQG